MLHALLQRLKILLNKKLLYSYSLEDFNLFSFGSPFQIEFIPHLIGGYAQNKTKLLFLRRGMGLISMNMLKCFYFLY